MKKSVSRTLSPAAYGVSVAKPAVEAALAYFTTRVTLAPASVVTKVFAVLAIACRPVMVMVPPVAEASVAFGVPSDEIATPLMVPEAKVATVEFTVKEKEAEVNAPFTSVIRTVKVVAAKETVAVPEICPVDVLKLIPEGKVAVALFAAL